MKILNVYYKGLNRDPWFWYYEVRRISYPHPDLTVQSSKIYKCPIDTVYEKNNIIHNIQVEDIDSVDAVFKYKCTTDGKLALLNFSSFVSPGGGFLGGALAQEECICHESNLAPVLSDFFDFYEENRSDENNGLYYNRALYTPDIVFLKELNMSNIEFADVITCAAPFKRQALINGISEYECYTTLKSRIQYVLDIAQDNNVDTLILGAYGCGVFENDPNDVAKIFKELLNSGKYNFKNVIFAIPKNLNKLNYYTFKDIFENN